MKFLAVFSLIVSLVSGASAQHQTFTANPDTSEIRIKLNTTHEVVNGTFHVQSGVINFDRTVSKISGIVLVGAATGKTGNDSRDKKMNKDILKIDQFATVSFAPKTYSGTIPTSGDSAIQVSGVFTLLGAGHDVTIPMHVHVGAKSIIARGRVNRNPVCLNPTAPMTPPAKNRAIKEISRLNVASSSATFTSVCEEADEIRPMAIPMSVTIPVRCVVRMTEPEIFVIIAF
jgi:hypothetical protein